MAEHKEDQPISQELGIRVVGFSQKYCGDGARFREAIAYDKLESSRRETV
jgi:hypothetical protein